MKGCDSSNSPVEVKITRYDRSRDHHDIMLCVM